MKQIFEHLDQSMQDIYRKAIDADQKLAQLKKQGYGKHQAILSSQSSYRQQHTTFMPYVAELAEDVASFQQDPSEKQQLVQITQKMQQLLQVLTAFEKSL